jgi:hypothetical protein
VPASTSHWFATWTASPSEAPARPPRDSVDRTPTLYDQTVRLIVRTSIAGDSVRIRVSNEYGDRPLVIGAAHVAVRTTGADIDAPTDHALTFAGKPSLRLLPGGIAFSDAVAFAVPATRDLAISLHVADSARLATRHALALQTNYVRRGMRRALPRLPLTPTFTFGPFSWVWMSPTVQRPASSPPLATPSPMARHPHGTPTRDGRTSSPNDCRPAKSP